MNMLNTIKTLLCGTSVCLASASHAAAPQINNAPVLTGTVGTPYTFDLGATDADGDTLSYAVHSWPQAPGLTISDSGVVTWALANHNDAGKYTVLASVRDSNNDSNFIRYKLIVDDPNNSEPIITNLPVTEATVGLPYTYDLGATDADGDTLRYSLYVWPENPGLSLSEEGVLSWHPTEHNQAGEYAVVMSVYDDNNGSNLVRYKLIVTDPNNHLPVINNTPALTATEGVPYTFNLGATDDDGDSLSYSLYHWPSRANSQLSQDGIFTWTPTADDVIYRHAIHLKVSDGNNGEATLFYQIDVQANPDTDGDSIANDIDPFPNDPLQNTSPQHSGISYTYNTFGQILTIDGPRTDVSDTTTYTYDATTQYRNSMTDAMGNTTQLLNHNGRGQPQLMIDANGTHTQLAYNVRGWLLNSTVIDPNDSGDGSLNSTTTYTYDNTGNITQITRPDGVQLNYHYDTSNRLIAVSNNLGERIDYTLDNAGNRTAQTIADGSSVITYQMTQSFDELSRVMNVVDANNNTTHTDYDTNNNPVQTINPRSYATQHQYDALNRLTQTTDTDNGTTHFAYDDQDRLTSVTDANGNTTTYDYDAFDNLIKEVSPDTGETRHAYDNAGNRIASVDSRGIVTQYTYDALNRLTAVNYPLYPEENVTYDYDVDTYQDANGQTHTVNAKGRLFRISDESGQILYAYDHRGNITSQLQTIGKDSNPANNPVYWTDYLYDTGNKLTQMQVFLPDGSLSYATTYQYDSVGRVINISYQTQSGGSTHTLASNLHYVPFGGLTQLTYGNGVHTQLAYDQNYRLSGWLTTSDTSTLLERSYSYDANSNVTQIDHLQIPADSQNFTYDLLDRLLSSNGGFGELIYTYDPVGNRLTETQNQGPYTYVEDYGYDASSNALLNIILTPGNNNTEYVVDARGNTTAIKDSDGETRIALTYNAANKVSSAIRRYNTQADYIYNALSQRTSKTYAGTTTHYVYNLNGQLMGEYQNGQAVVEYIYLANQPLAQLRNGQTYYYHNDHLGTPTRITDSAQQVVWARTLSPFGDVGTYGGSVENNLRFPGQYFDIETLLLYNWHRYYDPQTGRYTQSDFIGLNGGINTYAYANNNPLIYIDPTGKVGFVGAAAGVFIGAVGGASGAIAAGQNSIGIVTSVFAGAVTGGIVGAVNPGAAFASGTAAAAITGAAIGATSNITGQAVSITLNPEAGASDFSPGSVIANGAFGAGGGLVRPILSPVIGTVGNTIFERIKPFVLENFLQPPQNDLYQCRS